MAALIQSFDGSENSHLMTEFLDQGFVIRDVEDRAALDRLRREVVAIAADLAGRHLPDDDGEFLDHIHSAITVEKLNPFRLHVYRELNAEGWLRPTYFHLARRSLEHLVGNELAMQNRINFSIQMPSERTSLLDIHADAFAGETPYQVVQWLPLVDVWDSKSMFILPRAKSEAILKQLKDFSDRGMQGLYDEVEDDLIWLTIPYGKVLIFSPNLLHGNAVNREPTTRWSMNCRFKGLFTPYDSAEKSLGSFYLPITMRPATRLGMAYQEPDGYEE
jgi:sporadic carbohydrate cluster 2OG-Fe(II) oxygenase